MTVIRLLPVIWILWRRYHRQLHQSEHAAAAGQHQSDDGVWIFKTFNNLRLGFLLLAASC